MAWGMAPQHEQWPKGTSPLDKWVVALIAAGGAAMLMGNLVILLNRTYRPIKSKSVPLTLLSSLGGLFWIIAVLVANDHFERRNHSGLNICILWTYWLQVCGFALWLSCLTFRLIALYRIFICKKDAHMSYPLLFLLLLPAVVFCIVASSLHLLKYKEAPSPSPKGFARADCQFQRAYLAYVFIGLLIMYYLVFFWFAFKLRNVMEQFNEFRLIRRGGILSLFLFLLSLVTIQTHAYYKPEGRCLLSAAVASAIFYFFWDRNGVVVYNVLFNRKEYEEKFDRDVRRNPSPHERETLPARFLEREVQLKDVRAEVEKYQHQIKQLEDEVEALEVEYAAMQQSIPPYASPTPCESILKDSC